MLMPLSIDMYLPALPVIAAEFGVPAGSAQMTLSTYILGFAGDSWRNAGVCGGGGSLRPVADD